MKRRAPRSVEEYFEGLRPDQRATLGRLRKTLRAAMPKAEEVLSYHIPTFKHDGRFVVAYAAFDRHCSLFGLTNDLLDAHPEWKPYASGRGTLRFTEERPLPSTLVRKIVRLRLAQNKAVAKERAARKAARKRPAARRKAKPAASRKEGAPPRRRTRASRAGAVAQRRRDP